MEDPVAGQHPLSPGPGLPAPGCNEQTLGTKTQPLERRRGRRPSVPLPPGAALRAVRTEPPQIDKDQTRQTARNSPPRSWVGGGSPPPQAMQTGARSPAPTPHIPSPPRPHRPSEALVQTSSQSAQWAQGVRVSRSPLHEDFKGQLAVLGKPPPPF